jgi:hypothetical protein
MNTVQAIIIGIHICSLLFLAVYLKLLFNYERKYKMTESRFTLLFGFINISNIAFAYILTIGLFAITTIFLLPYF